jgi:hypothetical protein
MGFSRYGKTAWAKQDAWMDAKMKTRILRFRHCGAAQHPPGDVQHRQNQPPADR